MNGTKAFYEVSKMIAEHENAIEQYQEYIQINKGDGKKKETVAGMRSDIRDLQNQLKPLYRIRNTFY